jgi:uncharacterized membrane protein YedE/YeeE
MYIDPNTGGMLFQILVVMFGVISAVILLFSGKIRIAFAKLRRRMRSRSNPEAQETFSEDVTPPPAA